MKPAEFARQDRDAAAEIILDEARAVDPLTVADALKARWLGENPDADRAFQDYCQSVAELIRTATVTVEWPEDTEPDR